MKIDNSNISKKLSDSKIKKHNYATIILLFMILLYFIISDTENKLFIQTNSFTQLLILLSFSFITSIIYLFTKTDLGIFLSCLLFSFFSIISIRLYVNSNIFRLLLSITLFTLYSIKLTYIIAISTSIVVYLLIIINELNLTVFGIGFSHYSQNEMITQYIIQFIALVFILYGQLKSKRMHEYKSTLLIQEIYIQKLIDNNLGFQNLAAKIDRDSRIEERLHITREIHDITGYTLTSMIMMMEYCKDLIKNNEKEKAINLLQFSNKQAREGHNEIRRELKQLRTIEEENVPFENKIDKIIQNFKKITGMIFDIEYTNFKIDKYPQYNHIILRFIQEGLTNSFRHGKATKVKLIFFISTSDIILSIEDNGVGTEKVIEGIGLSGMQERLKRYNGELKYFSTTMGFSIIAKLPIKGEKD